MNGVRDLSLTHLETKYAKTNSKNGIRTKNSVRNTWVKKSQRGQPKKVNPESQPKKSTVKPEKSTQKVNGQLEKSTVNPWSKSTVNRSSADVAMTCC
jgi:hypothetical protein